MNRPTEHSELEPLNALVGEWATEAAHPAFPSTVVHGRTQFEWLEGERFLIQRSRTEHPEFPDAIGVIGIVDDALSLHYFDSRGVHRVYDVALDDGDWRMSREAPGFSQRFAATFADADTVVGVWELSQDDSTWANDLEVTYRRLRPPG
jgi:hypothetical protein